MCNKDRKWGNRIIILSTGKSEETDERNAASNQI